MAFDKKDAADSYQRLVVEFNETELEGVNTGFKQTRGLERVDALDTDEETVYVEETRILDSHTEDWSYQKSIRSAQKVVKESKKEGKWSK